MYRFLVLASLSWLVGLFCYSLAAMVDSLGWPVLTMDDPWWFWVTTAAVVILWFPAKQRV